MRAVDQWTEIQGDLPDGWTEVRIAFAPEVDASQSAAILAPLTPGRVGDELLIHVSRSGSGPERVRNVLRHLDQQRVWGTLRLVGTSSDPRPELVAHEAEATVGLADAWDALQAELPPDWSDVLCQLDLDSTDHIPRASLLGAPLNPARVAGEVAIRFRASRRHGYGASPGMVRRCLERMDAAAVTGRLTVVLGLSDSDHAVTQGPVWRVAGRSV